MSVTWMSVIAIILFAQKLLPANAAVDVPLALAIVGLGILLVIAPRRLPDSRRHVRHDPPDPLTRKGDEAMTDQGDVRQPSIAFAPEDAAQQD